MAARRQVRACRSGLRERLDGAGAGPQAVLIKGVLSLLSPAGPKARLSVLIFHRVVPRPDPLFPQEVDAGRFDQICRWISGWFNVLPLDEAVRKLRSETLPARAAAITFDDGYADNHEVALPVLERHRLCATFFIATGFLDGGCMWNDVVIEAVRNSAASRLDLRSLDIAELQCLDVSAVDVKRRAIDAILNVLKYLPETSRREAAAHVARAAGVSAPMSIMMTSRQVVELHRAGMRIGAHTVSHPILASLDREHAGIEIRESKRFLEVLLDDAVPLFAYPNGKPGSDFTEESATIARESGFEAALSTEWGVASSSTDPYSIPRFTPWDQSRFRFAARLAGNLRTSPRPST